MHKRLDLAQSLPRAGELALIILIASLPGPGSLAAGTPAPPASPPDLASLLPGEILGYVPQEKDGLYTADTLFDLIDGGAEVYRTFHLHKALSRRYGKPDAPDLLVDLFDMGSSRDAFGAYHHDLRDGKDAGVGAESEIDGSTLAFWKDRYFVSIVPLADAPRTEGSVMALGREIGRRIPETGSMPEIVRLLPSRGLERDRLSYFHDWIYLNTRYAMTEENLLLLDGRTEGVLARYRVPASGAGKGSGSSRLLLIAHYSSRERARQAAERFLSGYLPGADSQGVARRGDGKWGAAQAQGDLVVAVLEAEEKPDMAKLVSDVMKARESREDSGHEH